MSTVVRPVTLSYSCYVSHVSSDGTFNPFGNFKFAGEVRPKYPLSPKRVVPPHIQRPDYAEDGTIKKFFRGVMYAV
jgi:hypothetical protein